MKPVTVIHIFEDGIKACPEEARVEVFKNREDAREKLFKGYRSGIWREEVRAEGCEGCRWGGVGGVYANSNYGNVFVY